MGQNSREQRRNSKDKKAASWAKGKGNKRGEEGKEERRSRASPRAESRELESNPCPGFDFR